MGLMSEERRLRVVAYPKDDLRLGPSRAGMNARAMSALAFASWKPPCRSARAGGRTHSPTIHRRAVWSLETPSRFSPRLIRRPGGGSATDLKLVNTPC